MAQAETVSRASETRLPASFFETSDRFEKIQLIEQLKISDLPAESDDMLADSDDTLNIAAVLN